MKDFWKMLLAVVCGLLLFGFITMFIFGSALSASMSATQGKTPVLPREGVLAVDMSTFTLAEQENPMPSFNGGENVPMVSLYKAVEAVKEAAADPGVKCVFLRTDGNLSSAASIEELRKALEDGTLSQERWQTYLQLHTENEWGKAKMMQIAKFTREYQKNRYQGWDL